MRIGTTIILLAAFLIAFGFAISDDMRVREQNTELEIDIQEQSQFSGQVQGSLAICESTVLENKQTIAELDNEISVLNTKIVEKENEIAALEAVNGQILGQKSELEVRVRDLEVQIAEAEKPAKNTQVEEIAVDLQGTTSILLVVVLIAQIALNLALNLRLRMRLNKKQEKSEYIRLTPKERLLIIKYRRSKGV